MGRTTISWGDGSGDNIYLDYNALEGTQTVTVSSDANSGSSSRTKTITFSTTGATPVTQTLTLVQAGYAPDLVIITRNNVAMMDNNVAVGYPDENVLYSLYDYTCDGTAATAINTGLTLFDGTYTTGWKLEFSATVLEIKPGTGDPSISCLIVGNEDTSTPWPGFFFAIRDGKFNGDLNLSSRNNFTENISLNDTITGSVVYTGSSNVITLNGNSHNVSGASRIHNWPMCIGGGPPSNQPNTWDSNRFAIVHFDYILVTKLVNA